MLKYHTMRFLLILFIAVPWSVNAQNYDSLRQVIKDLQAGQYKIELNLQKANEQYSSGTLLLGIGVATSVIGAMLHTQSDDPGPAGTSLMIGGGATALVGGIIQIDSHKWIGRAGRRR